MTFISRSYRRRASWVIVGLALVALTGCASGVSIAQLQRNPGRYADRTITVSGTVTRAWGVPFMPMRMFQVDDGTGELLVVSEDRGTPTRGSRVRVRGRVEELAVVDGRSLGLHLRSRDVDVR